MTAELLDDFRAATRAALNARAGQTGAAATDIVDELGLAGLYVDSARGGLDMGEKEAALVSEELGRTLVPSTFLPTAVLAVTLLQHSDTQAGQDALAALVNGESRYAVAISNSEGRWPSALPLVSATSTPAGGWRLDGTATGLTSGDGSAPDVVLVSAMAPGGAALFTVDADGADVIAADRLDPSRGLIDVRLHNAAAHMVVGAEVTPTAMNVAFRRALTAVAAEQVGVARACLDSAVDYAKTRQQFGANIGSFQAIKHRCAEILLNTELADAVVAEAVGQTDLANAELAFVVATRAAVTAAEACIHIHGGIGFTWEHPAHRYLRRARVNAEILGPITAHRAEIAESVGL